MRWPDGTTFTGHWEYNATYGQGTIQEPNSDSYTGNWHNNMFCGEGSYRN